MTVEELINELMQVKDKTKEVEIPEHCTQSGFTSNFSVEEIDGVVTIC